MEIFFDKKNGEIITETYLVVLNYVLKLLKTVIISTIF